MLWHYLLEKPHSCAVLAFNDPTKDSLATTTCQAPTKRDGEKTNRPRDYDLIQDVCLFGLIFHDSSITAFSVVETLTHVYTGRTCRGREHWD